MTWHKTLIAVPVALVVAASAPAAEDLRAPGATVEKLAGDLTFTEGPTADAAGNVFFTDQPNDRILEVERGRQALDLPAARRTHQRHVLRPRREPDRLRRREERAVVHRPKDGKVTVIWQGLRRQAAQRPQRRLGPPERRPLLHRSLLQAPVVVPPDAAPGRPARLLPLGRPQDAHPRHRATSSSPTASSARPTARRSTWPTSGAARPTPTTSSRTGASPDKRLFCSLGSDGMTIDEEGNLYLTGKGVHVFDKTGQGDRAHRRPRGLDRQRLLRRRRPQDPVHHRQQGALRGPAPGQGCERREVERAVERRTCLRNPKLLLSSPSATTGRSST